MERINLKDLMGETPYTTKSRYEQETAEYDRVSYPQKKVLINNGHVLVEEFPWGVSMMNKRGLAKMVCEKG